MPERLDTRERKRYKRKRPEKRAALPDELENPETYGVRVRYVLTTASLSAEVVFASVDSSGSRTLLPKLLRLCAGCENHTQC